MNTSIKQYFFVWMLCSLSCNSNTETNEQTQDSTRKETAQTPQLSDECYTYLAAKDSVRLHLKLNGNAVSGELIYTLFGKDNNTGTIQGQMKGDTIFADYTFRSEGIESVREIALLKKGDSLTEGYGEVKEVNNKMVFTNPKMLDFRKGIRLVKTECE